jgi:chemotaxis methyl-accepting protein methylase
MRLAVLGTDVDAHLIERGAPRQLSLGSLREVREERLALAFERREPGYAVRDALRRASSSASRTCASRCPKGPST